MRLDNAFHGRPARAWRNWLLAPVLMVLLLLAACGDGGTSGSSSAPPPSPTPPSPSAKAKATVLVYMVGSDLESKDDSATENIEEMMKVGSSRDLNIILETGGAKKEGWTTVRRQRIVKDGAEMIAELGAQRMTDAANLRKFIEWGVQTYPAQSYHLVFWDHGGGPLGGFGIDENYTPAVTMQMPDLAAAMDGAQRTTGVKFDLIGFDACLMASAEVAYMLSPHGRYMVASQEVEPGGGWDWEAYLRHLADHADATPVSAGKVIVDSFLDKMEREDEIMVTMSLTDLSKVPPLMNSLNDLAATIVGQLDDPDPARRHDAWAELAYARRYTHDFQTSWIFGNAYDLVDLADFVTMPKLGGLGVSEAQIDAVQKALEEAVVYSKHGRRLWAAGGLTLYSPLVSVKKDSASPYTKYAAMTVPDGIKAMVQRYGDIANSPGLPQPDVGTLQFDGDIVYATLENPKYSSTEYAALRQGTERLAIKPLDAVAPQGPPDEVRIAATQSDWFQIPSADGSDVLVSVLPDDIPRYAVGQAQYTVPVSLGGNEGVLLVDYEEDAGGEKTYRIVGYLDSESASPYAARPDSKSLTTGTVLYPMVWTGGKWEEDKSRMIISQAIGDENTPRDQWWQLKTVTSASICGGACNVGLEAMDFKGEVVQ